MGRKAPRKLYRLDFSDTPYGAADEDGDPLEVLMTGLSMQETLDTLELQSLFDRARENEQSAAQIVQQIAEMLAKHLVEWNLEDPDNGDPIAPTKPALLAQDPTFLFDLLRVYRSATMSVGKEPSQTSNDGGPVQEASLPMELLSESLSSSSEQNSSSMSSNDSPDTPLPPFTEKKENSSDSSN